MEADRIVARKDFQEIPPRVEYSLTEFGVSLAEALRPLCEWGREHTARIETNKAEEGMRGSRDAAVEHAPDTELKIKDEARRLLRAERARSV